MSRSKDSKLFFFDALPDPEEAPTVGTISDVESYTKVIRNLDHEEMFAAGGHRLALSFIAEGIANFLRRRPWIDEETEQAGFALADRAAEIAEKCRRRPLPRGQT